MRKIRGILKLAVCIFLCVGMFEKTKLNADAASEYVQLFETYESGVEKSGDYYIKLSTSNGTISVAESENGTYKTTSIKHPAFSNGTNIYYMANNVLYKYVLSSGKTTTLKTFSFAPNGDDGYSISTVYRNKIYITRGSFNAWRFWTYVYSTKTKKTELVQSDCDIIIRSGKYVIGAKEYRTDVSPQTYTLYKITSSGSLKKIKKITSYGKAATLIGSRLYYTVYQKDSMMKKATLCSCSIKTGGNKKKIGTFTGSSSGYSEVYVLDITAKSCTVQIGSGKYKYTYATKKLKYVGELW